MIGGGVGCGHGFTQLYRKCIDLTDANANAPRPPGAYVVLLPEMRALADSIPGDSEYQDWDGVEVVVIRPPPPAPD